jgi:hypothetical protein
MTETTQPKPIMQVRKITPDVTPVVPQISFLKKYRGAIIFFALLSLSAFLLASQPSEPSSGITPEQLKRQDLQQLNKTEEDTLLLISRLKLQDLPQAEQSLATAQSKVDNLKSSLTQARTVRDQIEQEKNKITNSQYSPELATEQEAMSEVKPITN